ncbi:MAG: ATP-binding protein [Nocardioides sp.]
MQDRRLVVVAPTLKAAQVAGHELGTSGSSPRSRRPGWCNSTGSGGTMTGGGRASNRTHEADRLRRSGALQVTATAPPVRVHGDPVQLAQVLRNLADNAARHAKGRVDLRLRTDGAHAVIEIEDDGPGIPQADRERVFERFVRLDESRTRSSGGTGLGLAIAREITAVHGGTLTVEEGIRGARLVLRLPHRPDAAT